MSIHCWFRFRSLNAHQAMMVNIHSRKFPDIFCNNRWRKSFSLRDYQTWRWNMRKLSYVLAALATIALPTIASAEGFGVYVGGDRDYYRGDRYYGGPRVEFYGHDRGW